MPIVNYHVRNIKTKRVYSSKAILDFQDLFPERPYKSISNMFKHSDANQLYRGEWQFLKKPMEMWDTEEVRYNAFPAIDTIMAGKVIVAYRTCRYYVYLFNEKKHLYLDRAVGLGKQFGLTDRAVKFRLSAVHNKNNYLINNELFVCRAEDKDRFKYRIEIFSKVDRNICKTKIWQLTHLHTGEIKHFNSVKEIHAFLLERGIKYSTFKSIPHPKPKSHSRVAGLYRMERLI